MVRDYERFEEIMWALGELKLVGPITIDLAYVTSVRPYPVGMVAEPPEVDTFTIVTVVGSPVPFIVSEHYERIRHDVHQAKMGLRG